MIMHSYFIITFVSLYFLFSLTHSQLSLVRTFFTIDIFVVLKAFWLLISYTINDRIAEILITLFRMTSRVDKTSECHGKKQK